jgi:hypothetical protein
MGDSSVIHSRIMDCIEQMPRKTMTLATVWVDQQDVAR